MITAISANWSSESSRAATWRSNLTHHSTQVKRSELRQLLFQLQHRDEEVAVLLDPLQHLAGLEDQL